MIGTQPTVVKPLTILLGDQTNEISRDIGHAWGS
jgi:hypothetical protein